MDKYGWKDFAMCKIEILILTPQHYWGEISANGNYTSAKANAVFVPCGVIFIFMIMDKYGIEQGVRLATPILGIDGEESQRNNPVGTIIPHCVTLKNRGL